MNFIEQLQSLDMNDPGRWPLPFRIGAVAIAFVLVGIAAPSALVADRAALLTAGDTPNPIVAVLAESETPRLEATIFSGEDLQGAAIAAGSPTIPEREGRTALALAVAVNLTSQGFSPRAPPSVS